jgi:hypothetical protein
MQDTLNSARKRLKIEVICDKRLGLDLGVKDLIFPGGYSQDLQDTNFRSNPYRMLQGLLRKKHLLLP